MGLPTTFVAICFPQTQTLLSFSRYKSCMHEQRLTTFATKVFLQEKSFLFIQIYRHTSRGGASTIKLWRHCDKFLCTMAYFTEEDVCRQCNKKMISRIDESQLFCTQCMNIKGTKHALSVAIRSFILFFRSRQTRTQYVPNVSSKQPYICIWFVFAVLSNMRKVWTVFTVYSFLFLALMWLCVFFWCKVQWSWNVKHVTTIWYRPRTVDLSNVCTATKQFKMNLCKEPSCHT